jgi:tryptophan-rich sensory protein
MKKALVFIIPLIVCFAVGYSASLFQVEAIAEWYPDLNKPALTPPNIVFPIVWFILYVLMSVSIGLILNTKTKRHWFFINLFILQLLFNFTWSITFFYIQNPLSGFINILILDVLVIFYILESYPVSKLASALFVPYGLWVLFATYLNGYIMVYN